MRLEHLLSGARRFPSGLGNGSMASRLYPLDMETYKGKERKMGLCTIPAKLTVLYLSWLERYTDNVEVGSSNLPGTTKQRSLTYWKQTKQNEQTTHESENSKSEKIKESKEGHMEDA